MTQIESKIQIGKVPNKDLAELEDEISLPIKSIAQLDEIEEKLKSRAFLAKMQPHLPSKANVSNWDLIYIRGDIRIQKKVIYVKRFGGSDVNLMTTGILKKLLDDCVAEQFSWDGKRNKKEFKILLIAKVLKRAVSSACPNYTEIEI
ncbi:uncharacterized protein [Temnothorax nylanderi]|uniref:uncharacterized protein n=1 Tax=Temnothorax nylanderi TaxID=102681 RepID=UPI003A83EB68